MRVKIKFNNKKQRYLCKNADPQSISDEKQYSCILEGSGFRRIEKILKVSHVSVINWVKKPAQN